MTSPNLFDYATKELSQDAVICWLIQWCEQEEDAELHNLGRRFLLSLFNKHCRDYVLAELQDSKIQVEIRRQEKQIDVLVRINGKYVLLIENKTFSGRHDKQLYRYRDSVLNGETEFTVACRDDLFSIYLKTGTHTYAERHKIDEDSELGYKVYDRRDFLEVLNTYHGNNSIVVDFRNYLWQLESKSQSFLNWTEATKKDAPQLGLGSIAP